MQAALWTRSAGERRGVGSAALMAFALVVLAALALAGAPVHGGTAEGAKSLAILETDRQLAPLSALLQAKLSQEGLVLVERKELEKILNEQKLSASGLVHLDALVKVGRLVRADAFLLLSLQKTKPVAAERGYGAPTAAASGAGLPDGEAGEAGADAQPEWLVRARLTETAHGVRLLDWFVAWDPQKVEQAAAEVAAKVSEVAPKLMLPAGQVIPVGILGVRSVELDREYRPACRALCAMLAARLSREPRIVVLEREDLGRMAGEKVLTEGEDAQFWRSGVLIEGYIQRRGKEGIELKLQLKHPSGEELPLAPLPLDVNKLQDAVEESVQAIVLQLTSSPAAASWDPAREAEVFYRQAGLSLFGYSETALSSAETAVALDPANEEYGFRLMLCALDSASAGVGGVRFLTRLELAELVSRFLPLALKRIEESPASDPYAFWLMLRLLRYFNGPRSVVEALEVNRENRKMVAKLYDDRYSVEWEGNERYAGHLATIVLTASSTPAEGLANLKEAMRQLVMPPDEGGIIASEDGRGKACGDFLLDFGPDLGFLGARHLNDLDNTLRRGLLAYLEELSGSRDVIVRFFGCLGTVRLAQSAKQQRSLYPSSGPWREQRAWDEREAAFFGSVDTEAYLDKVFAAYRERTSALPALGPDARCRMLVCLFRAANELYPPEKRIPVYESLCYPLIGERDAAVLAYVLLRVRPGLLPPSGPYDSRRTGATPTLALRTLLLLEKARGVLEGQADQAEALYAARHVDNSLAWMRDGWRTHLRRLESSVSALEGQGKADQAQAARISIAEITAAFPEFVGKPKPRGFSVKMLVKAEDWPAPWASWGRWYWCAPAAKDGVLWIAFVRGPVGLAGVDLRSSRPVALWQAAFSAEEGGPIVGRLALTDQRIYMATFKSIVELPGTIARGKGFIDRPRVLTVANGLPPGRILGMAPLGEKLWISYTDAGKGLGIYDPRTETWERICSSDLPADTPLQKVAAYGLFELTPVPDGLMFFVGGANYQDLNGLWRFDSATGAVERLFSFSPSSPTNDSPTTLKGTEEERWIADSSLLARIVPRSAKVELSALADFNSTVPENLAKYHQGAWTCEMSPFVSGRAQAQNTVAWLPRGMVNPATGAVFGDDLWARYGATQLIVLHRGKSFEEATLMDNDILEGRAVLDFFPTPYGIIAVGEGCVGLIEGSP